LGIRQLGQVGSLTISEAYKSIPDLMNTLYFEDIVTLKELTDKAILINPRAKYNRSQSQHEKNDLELEHKKLCEKIETIGNRLVKLGWYKKNEKKSKKNEITLTPEFVVSENKGIGYETAKSLLEFIRSDKGRKILNKFHQLGIPKLTDNLNSVKFKGKIFVMTGALPKLTRQDASELIIKNGGTVSNSISKNTSFLLAGEKAGSKLVKAKDYGIEVISEEDFLKMIS
jgi:NAD-dependent DNA ligase